MGLAAMGAVSSPSSQGSTPIHGVQLGLTLRQVDSCRAQ